MPTLAIDVNKNGKYKNIISVRKYEGVYNNVGGINAPKKIVCTGTDGIERPQLVKVRHISSTRKVKLGDVATVSFSV